jgi:hypothetical protein
MTNICTGNSPSPFYLRLFTQRNLIDAAECIGNIFLQDA